jgi:hypothetical protein
MQKQILSIFSKATFLMNQRGRFLDLCGLETTVKGTRGYVVGFDFEINGPMPLKAVLDEVWIQVTQPNGQIMKFFLATEHMHDFLHRVVTNDEGVDEHHMLVWSRETTDHPIIIDPKAIITVFLDKHRLLAFREAGYIPHLKRRAA